MTCARVAELTGWLSGLFGILGSLVLVFPVLYLLSSREAGEDLGESGGAAHDARTERLFVKARSVLWRRLRNGRRTARTIVCLGALLLFVALMFAGFQGYCVV
ncbi:MAG: hypothetical protein JO001_07835 [Alphaproteobacteria bacterium]|nr:hypothetical protein [Alphaproteobacteria bacterium]